MCPHLLFSFFDFVYVLLVCEGNNSFLFFLFFSFPFGRTVDKGGEQFWMELNSILFLHLNWVISLMTKGDVLNNKYQYEVQMNRPPPAILLSLVLFPFIFVP